MTEDTTVLYDTLLYARVSTTDQDIKQQIEKLWNHATDDLDLDPDTIDILEDEATGTNTDRDGYQELMRRVENGEPTRIIVRSLTRLGRNMRDLYETVYTIIEDHEIGLHAINDGFSVEAGGEMTTSDKAYLNALSLAAEMEADMIRQRTLDGLRAAERAGKWTHRPPYGFTTNDEGYLQTKPDEYRKAVEAILAVEELDWSHRKVERHVGVPRRTVPNVLDRRDLYLDDQMDAERAREAREGLSKELTEQARDLEAYTFGDTADDSDE